MKNHASHIKPAHRGGDMPEVNNIPPSLAAASGSELFYRAYGPLGRLDL
jgi:hypothetical protein